MKSIVIQFVLFCLAFCSAEVFRKCGELDTNRAQAAPMNPELSFQNELEEIFDAFRNGDTEHMEELLNLLGNQTIAQPEYAPAQNAAQKIIKYVPDRIKSEGYPAEVHEVQTEDGYILELHRIPYGRSGKTDARRTPVYIMHGFLESSSGWIVLGPDNSLAYMLADAGYDVWLGNARGTENSCKHKNLKPNGLFQKAFWSFSWHEIGHYDLPASIDYILNETKHEKLNYIGYSQGTTAFLVMTSTRPEYNDKIIESNLLAPVAFLSNATSTLYKTLAFFYTPLTRTAEILHVYKFNVYNKLLLDIVKLVCSKSRSYTPLGCQITLSVFDSNQINCTSLPLILANTPAGVSLRQGIHYIQNVRSGDFLQFDYDDKEINMKKYGSATPPAYDLSKITAPINLFYSKDDDTACVSNVLRLKSKLPNLKSSYLVSVNDFKHVDFVYSRYLRKAVNEKLITTINRSNQNY